MGLYRGEETETDIERKKERDPPLAFLPKSEKSPGPLLMVADRVATYDTQEKGF